MWVGVSMDLWWIMGQQLHSTDLHLAPDLYKPGLRKEPLTGTYTLLLTK